MKFGIRTPLVVASTLVVALAGCQDAAEEAPDAAAVPVASAPTDASVAVPPTAVVSAEGAFLDPNAASRDELLGVPGVDATLADAIIAGRPYTDMRGVDRVLAARLSEEQRDTAYTRLWMPLDLNSAAAEEITLIPGVGNRMRHEFEEYRPYRGIEQFRREIGKYVDDAEVARLERYVTIR